MKRAYCVHTGTVNKNIGWYVATDYTIKQDTEETPYWQNIAWYRSRATAQATCRMLNHLGYAEEFKVHSRIRHERLEDVYDFVD